MTIYVYYQTYTTTQYIVGIDTAYVPFGGLVFSTIGGAGITGTNNGNADINIQVDGTVFGSAGIQSNAGTGTTYVFVGKTGVVSSLASGIGVYVSSVAGAHQIVNEGQIYSIGGDGWGVFFANSGSVVNDGAIAGALGIYDQAGAGATNYVVNNGTITGTEYAFYNSGYADIVYFANYGTTNGTVAFGSGAGDALLNTGSMLNSGGFNGIQFGNGAGDAFANYGLIYDNSTPGAGGGLSALLMGDGAGDSVYNAGAIFKNRTPAGSTAVALGNGNGDVLYNDAKGLIAGDVKLGNGAGDVVVNAGIIYGVVTFGNGAGDYYDGRQGHVNGVVCGNGGDYIYSGAGVESVTAGLGNDYLTMANGGFTTVNEPLAAQQASNFDTVANFQSYNAAAGQGTFLHLAPALQAATGFFDYAGGALVYSALGGGGYSYIFAPGASVATVQAQTYFA